MSDYTPPGPPSGPPPGYSPPPGSPSGQFDLGQGFSWAWKKFQDNMATLIVSTLVVGVIAGVLYFVGSLIIGSIAGSGVSIGSDGTINSRGFFMSLVLSALSSLVASLAVYVLAANYVRMLLAIADGAKPEIGDLFNFDKVDKTVVLGVILTLGSVIGMILCYLPGLIWGFLTSYSLFFLKDQDQEPVDSIKSSFALTTGNLGQTILVYLVGAVVVFAGAILCGVGLLVAAPVAGLLYAYAYRSFNGRTVAP